jgi:hypothetical protein
MEQEMLCVREIKRIPSWKLSMNSDNETGRKTMKIGERKD